MSRFPFARFFALLAIVLIVLSACGGGTTTTTPTTAPAADATTAPATEPTAVAGSDATTAPAAEPTAVAGSDEVTTITWGFWGSPEERASHEKVAAEFEKTHPNIQIEIWHQPWEDYFTKLKTLWASGDTSQVPDVFFLWPTPTYAANGVLEDLTPYIQSSNYNLNDYWPALLESASYDNKVYGFPRDISVEVLYYNKDLFDQAGVSYPTDNWTWDDLAAAAKKLAVIESNGRVQRYGLAIEGGKWGLWVSQNKGALLDDFRNPSRCTLNEPAALDALKFYTGLLNDKVAMRDADLSQAGGDAAVFQSGQAAMIIQNSSRVSAFNAAKLNYDVATVPIPVNGQRAASAGGAAWVISSNSAHKDAAWTFLSWLQGSDGGQKLYTESGEIFPALQSVAKSEAFLQSGQPPKNRQAFLTEGENARVGRFGYFPEWDELDSTLVEPVLEKVWIGESTPDDAANQICQQVDTYLKDKGYPKP